MIHKKAGLYLVKRAVLCLGVGWLDDRHGPSP